MSSAVLAREPTLLRIGPSRIAGGKPGVDRTGGDFGAGLIRKAVVITEGEAKGHDLWIDRTMLGQVRDAIDESREGVKARFTHPSLSGDGLGKGLGRYRNATHEAGVVRADLHIFEAAHNAPDGDLAGYVMDLAEEDSRVFGNSIAYQADRDAEDTFVRLHSSREGEYQSPDASNEQNHPHARLARLRAVDVVDDPASNPTGLFHRGQEIAVEADDLLSYALGLSDKRPATIELDVDPDRVAGFVKGFLGRRGLKIERRLNGTTRKESNVIATLDKSASDEAKYRAETDELVEGLRESRRVSAPPAPATSFIEEARRIANAENIPLDSAMSNLSLERPSLAAEHDPRLATPMSKAERRVADEKRDAAMEEFCEAGRELAASTGLPLWKCLSQISGQCPALYRDATSPPRNRAPRAPERLARSFAVRSGDRLTCFAMPMALRERLSELAERAGGRIEANL